LSSGPTLRENLRALPRPAWILFVGTFINRFGTFVMPFLVIYLTRSGFSPAKAGLAVSAYGAGHLIASFAGGHLADRIGRRNTIAISMFGSAAVMVALSQARAFPVIIAFTLLAGSAAELYRPAAAALIGDLVRPEQRIAAFGMYRFAINLGFAAGPAVAGFLADRSFLYLFLGDAVTSLGYGIIAIVALPHGQRSHASEEKSGDALRDALHNKRFVLFLLSTLCVTWIEFQLPSTLPLYVQDQGFTASAYGMLISLNGILIVIFELAITAWTQRFQPQPMIALGYGLSAIGFALTGFAHTIPVLAMTVVVWTIGEMIYAPVTGAYVANLAPERYRGRYNGLWVMMWSVGMLLGPSLGTLIYQRDARVLWITCGIVGLAGAALALVKPGRPSPASAGEGARRADEGQS
jgi:MFS family permease